MDDRKNGRYRWLRFKGWACLQSDAKAVEAVRKIVWPNGVECYHCKSAGLVYKTKRQIDRCMVCKKDIFLLKKTPFTGAHQALNLWLITLVSLVLDGDDVPVGVIAHRMVDARNLDLPFPRQAARNMKRRLLSTTTEIERRSLFDKLAKLEDCLNDGEAETGD